MQIMNMTGYILFWYLLGVKLTWGHVHKTRSWYPSGVAFKKSEEHPLTFVWEFPGRYRRWDKHAGVCWSMCIHEYAHAMERWVPWQNIIVSFRSMVKGLYAMRYVYFKKKIKWVRPTRKRLAHTTLNWRAIIPNLPQSKPGQKIRNNVGAWKE